MDIKVVNGRIVSILDLEEFKTTKFFCKTDFDVAEIKKGETGYIPLLKFDTFNLKNEKSIPYKKCKYGLDVKEMIKDVLNKCGAK